MGPPGRRVAANLRRIRREHSTTTAALSQRLAAIGHPIADTGITKTEKGDRRVDADDLVALALALGVTPNTLLMPHVEYLTDPGEDLLTPVVGGTAEQMWQWAQGEQPIGISVEGARSWLGDGKYPQLEFSIRNRPYLTALRPSAPDLAPRQAGDDQPLRAVAAAVTAALAKGISTPAVRRVVELSMALPVTMKDREDQ